MEDLKLLGEVAEPISIEDDEWKLFADMTTLNEVELNSVFVASSYKVVRV